MYSSHGYWEINTQPDRFIEVKWTALFAGMAKSMDKSQSSNWEVWIIANVFLIQYVPDLQSPIYNGKY